MSREYGRADSATNMGAAAARAANSSWCRWKASSKRGCAGRNITPGYWRQPELTAKAFDEEGFYRLGDALKFEDPDNPGQGLLFDGRIAEDFKLATGTWVSVGPLRAQAVEHFAPYATRRGDRRRRPRRCRHPDFSRPGRLPAASPAICRRTRRCRYFHADPHVRPRSALGLRASPRSRPAAPTASAARCCWSSHRRSTPARSPTRARSTSAWCCAIAPIWSRNSTPIRSSPRVVTIDGRG